MKVLRTLALLCLFTVMAASQVVTTIAGSVWLFPGNGPALSSPLGHLFGVLVDPSGNVYASDADNNLIVKITPAGALTVVAGNGGCGYSGDGGPAVNASLCNPRAMALDSSGSLYIVDTDNNVIRRVTTSGIIGTIAGNGSSAFAGDGGPALAASFNSLTGIALDAAGNVYVGDNYRIRKFTPGGNISTIAGTGVEGFSGNGGPASSATITPRGMAFDASGNLYFSDADSASVRKINPSGVISAFAGGGSSAPNQVPATSAQLSAPNGLAVDGFGNVYIADGGGGPQEHIFEVNFAGVINIIAGAGVVGFTGDGGPAASATLNAPQAVAADPAGNLYIADTGNARIRKVNVSGTIATIAGNGMYRFSGDGGPARFASLNSPEDVAVDNAGNLYVTDFSNNRIRKIASNGIITTFAGTGLSGNSGDGGPAAAATFGNPYGIVLDAKGNLYVSEEFPSDIRMISAAGIITTVPGTSTGLNFPAGLTVDAAGNLYIADQYNHLIRKLAPGGTLTTIAGNGTAGFSGDGGPATAAELNYPSGVALDAVGNLYIADIDNHRVRKVTPGGIISTFAGNGTGDVTGDNGPAVSAGVPAPSQLLFDSAGNLYISEVFSGVIRRVTPNGIISTIAGGGSLGDGSLATQAALDSPVGMAIDSSGNFYFADDDRIREILNVPPIFTVSPAPSVGMSFTAPAGVPGIVTQQITIMSNIIGQAWSATASTQSGGGWLAIPAVAGSIPGAFGVSVNPGALPPGTYQGTVTVQVPVASPSTQTVPVTFTVTPSTAAQLQVQPAALNFSVAVGASSVQTLSVGNSGSGTLQWTTSSVSASGNWLTISPASGAASAAAPASVQVTVTPTGLAAGVYSGSVTITSAATSQIITVPVTLSVPAQAQTILLSQSGLLFTAGQGGAMLPAQTFGVINTGQGVMNWTATATTLTGGNWLSVTPSSGSSTAGSLQVPSVEADVNASGLTAGQYSGQVRIAASGANNSPQVVTVILSILPAGTNPGAFVRPTGLIFTALAGSSPSPQTVQVGTASSASVGYVAGVLTFTGNWLQATSLSGVISAGNNRAVQVQPAEGALAPGVYRGSLTLLFNDGSPAQVVDVLSLVVAPPSSKPALRLGSAVAACVPQMLLAVSRTLSGNFVSPAGWPTALEAQVIDDCGNAVSNATVVASFSNGDAALSLSSVGNGIYSGTWFSTSVSPQTVVTIRAFLPPLTPATVTIQGGVSGNSAAPAVFAGGVVNAASFAAGGVLAPGSIASVFGASLATSTAGASTLPLPVSLGGASLTIGGVAAPLFYSSSGQINAQIPFGLTPNTRPQVVLQTQTAISVPQTITLDLARPGIFMATAPQGVVVNIANQLVDATHPATGGDVVVIYCTGLGATTPPVSTNQTSPSPAAIAAIQPTVTVGGVNAPVQFAGLSPGLVGLYQVNVQIPAGVTTGSAVPMVMAQSGVGSNTVTIAVH